VKGWKRDINLQGTGGMLPPHLTKEWGLDMKRMGSKEG